MQIIIKLAVSLAIILIATAIGKRLPSTAGLIAVMPLAGVLVLVWMYIENNGDSVVMQNFTKGALWGILPSIVFYIVAMFCFRKHMPLSLVLTFSFGAWITAALIHQWFLR